MSHSRILRIVSFAAVCLIAANTQAAGPQDGASAQALNKLQGEWRIDWIEMGGERNPPDENQSSAPVVIEGDELRHRQLAFKITVDGGTDPKIIDIALQSEANPAPRFEGIYKLDGKQLTICIHAEIDVRQRPADFETTAGSKLAMVQLTKNEQ